LGWTDPTRRTACVERLRRAGAPVRELNGSAIEAARETITSIDQYGLHFAFLDPYNLGELDFSIIQTLLQLKRIDMLIHVSVMDLQRNLDTYPPRQTLYHDHCSWLLQSFLKQGRYH
jgi:three-Cys-motif partner protein